MADDSTEQVAEVAQDAEINLDTEIAPDAEIVLIVAVADNGVIGRDGGMPWHFPEDMKHFEETTTGHPVVLGRRTYESIAEQIGGPLPNRTNVVLSNGDPDVPESVRVVSSVAEAVDVAETVAAEGSTAEGTVDSSRIYVAGGANVYEQFLPLATRQVRTEIHESFAGDTTFPEWDRSAWREVSRDEREAFDFVTYVRREE
jgi:dihydrofolate reductase